MKPKEKQKAIKLRKAGFTYREILRRTPVSKGSLSYWLRDIELADEQKKRIYGKNLQIRRKFVEYNRLKRKKAVAAKKDIFAIANKEIGDISKRELKLIGTALYWAEGYKTNMARAVDFANADAHMAKIIMRWFREICNVPDDKFRVKIQIHNGGNVEEAIEFWALITGVPTRQFHSPYIRTSPTSKKKTGNFLPYGICRIRVTDIKLLTRIKGWIDGIKGPIV